jgi:hypothetical protein
MTGPVEMITGKKKMVLQRLLVLMGAFTNTAMMMEKTMMIGTDTIILPR